MAAGQPCLAVGKGFFEEDGLLYRRWTPPGRDDSMEVKQLVLPKRCWKTVLQLAHEIPLAGHMGKGKTTQRVLQRFYWPTVYQDVAEFCRSCESCQKCPHRKVPKAQLIPLPIISEPFQRIALDIVGPLPRSRSGNRYVLVICDYATRFPEAVPLRSIEAEKIAEELIRLFARVGIPNEILTDQGSNFTSQLLSELYRLLHVHPIRTSPYHPQTDGLVERFNQTLKLMLRKTAGEEGKDWDKLLPYLLFAYREVPQDSTGFSPYELLYGRSVRGPLDVLRESWVASSRSSESVVSMVLSVQDKMSQMTELVQRNLAKAQQRQKAFYDRNARQREFQAGEQVIVLLPTSSNKLLAQWQGPYTVVRRIGKVNYRIDMHDKRKRHRVFHINMLRKWHVPVSTNYWAEETVVDVDGEEVLTWREQGSIGEDQPAIGEQLSEVQRQQLEGLLRGYSDIMLNPPGRTNLAEHDVETGSARPIKQPPYRLPYAYRQEVQEELEEMLENGIIEESGSEWASPMVLVHKKDGSLRLCVDYRKLNGESRLDQYPMPRIDELTDRLGKARFISTLDLTKGYWQVPLTERARMKTAFVTPFGLYQFRVMPFGLQGGTGYFSKVNG